MNFNELRNFMSFYLQKLIQNKIWVYIFFEKKQSITIGITNIFIILPRKIIASS
jgi:tryptophan-rich sensory protein